MGLKKIKNGLDNGVHHRWLSVQEIAQYLGISKETVYRWLEKGKIPAHKIGKLWKFKISEVDRWVLDGGSARDQIES